MQEQKPAKKNKNKVEKEAEQTNDADKAVMYFGYTLSAQDKETYKFNPDGVAIDVDTGPLITSNTVVAHAEHLKLQEHLQRFQRRLYQDVLCLHGPDNPRIPDADKDKRLVSFNEIGEDIVQLFAEQKTKIFR